MNPQNSKGMENYDRKLCMFLRFILFEATSTFGKICALDTYTVKCLLFEDVQGLQGKGDRKQFILEIKVHPPCQPSI